MPRLAASTSYFAALSLAPLLVLGVAILARFYGSAGHAKTQLIEQISRFAGSQVAVFSETLLTNSAKHQESLWATILSIAITVWSASNLFLVINEAIYFIWKLPQSNNAIKNLVRTRLVAFLSVVLFGILLVLWLVFESWLAIAGSSVGGEAGRIGSLVASIPFFTLATGAIYCAIPPGKAHWRDVWVGALVVALGLTSGKYLLGTYFAWVKVSAAYGSAGALVVVLLWIYYASTLFFIGAEIVYLQTHRHQLVHPRPSETDEPSRS